MMKSIMSFAVICYALSALGSDAMAGGFVEVKTATPSTKDSVVVDIYVSDKITETFGVSAFFLTAGSWAEVYAGPEWSPVDWMTVGVSVGAEHGAEGFDLRTAAMLWMGHGDISFLGLVEAGEAAYSGDDTAVWYDLTLKYKVTPWLSVGIRDVRPTGIGPLAEVTVGKAVLWASWSPISSEEADFDASSSIFGAKYTF